MIKRFDYKLVKRCVDCRKELPKIWIHHLRCQKCWEKNREKIKTDIMKGIYEETIRGNENGKQS